MLTVPPIFPFIGKHNSSSNPEYSGTIGLVTPIIQGAVSAAVEKSSRMSWKVELIGTPLPDNLWHCTDLRLEFARRELIQELEFLKKHYNGVSPISLQRDSCFTNDLLERSLINVLWDEKTYAEYISVTRVNYEEPTSEMNDYPKKGIIISGGSLSDPDKVPTSYYRSAFAQSVRSAAIAPGEGGDVRHLLICFSQQVGVNLIGMANAEDPRIAMAIQWPAQYGNFPTTLKIDTTAPKIYQDIFRGIIWSGRPGEAVKLSAPQTRTRHIVTIDLSTDKRPHPSIIPLMTDDITGGIVASGIKNGRILAMQPHFELDLQRDAAEIQEKLSHLTLKLVPGYSEDIINILRHFDPRKEHPKGLGREFFTFALLAFAKSLRESIESEARLIHLLKERNVNMHGAEAYNHAIDDLQNSVREQASILFEHAQNKDSTQRFADTQSPDILQAYDHAEKLALNIYPDWKVDRWNLESSKLAGIKNIAELIRTHGQYMRAHEGNRLHIVRELGPGIGALMGELYESLRHTDTIIYGVGNAVYFDLYHTLKALPETEHIPDEALMLFVQETILVYKNSSIPTVYSRLLHALESLDLDPTKAVAKSSMFLDRTLMFSSENIEPIHPAAQEYLSKHAWDVVKLLTDLVKRDFHRFFHKFFGRIYVSDFSSFNPSSPLLRFADFQLGIRSTSHLSSEDFYNNLHSFVANFSSPGAVFLEEWVHASYTEIPRIKELHKLAKVFPDKVRIRLIYNPHNAKFPSAFIETAPFMPEEVIHEHIQDGMIIVPIEEAASATYFQYEAFLRRFIATSFRNHDVFEWNTGEILMFLRIGNMILSGEHESKVEWIFEEFFETSMNSMINDFHEKTQELQPNPDDRIKYDHITSDALYKYRELDGTSIKDIVINDYVHPSWFNPNALKNR